MSPFHTLFIPCARSYCIKPRRNQRLRLNRMAFYDVPFSYLFSYLLVALPANSSPVHNPTGTVTLYDENNTAYATVTLAADGTAAVTITLTGDPIHHGEHHITARYSGDSSYNTAFTSIWVGPS